MQGTQPINALVAQFPISLSIQENIDAISGILELARPGDLVVLPEGAVSGYAEDVSFLQEIDPDALARALTAVQEMARRRPVHLVCGSCLHEAGRWHNAGLYFGPRGEHFVYRKINLATSERGHFTPGDRLPVFPVEIRGRSVKLAIQLCREIRFPEQWQCLARAGAQLFAFLTNAVDDPTGAQAPVWRSHLISRAAENQRFVLAANNAGPGQKCPSMIVAPDGKVLWEALSASLAVERREIDLAQVSDWYLGQGRRDLDTVQPTPPSLFHS